MALKVEVDKDACIACGLCWSLCGDVFEQDPETGKTRVTAQYIKQDDPFKSTGEVPDEVSGCVNDAAGSCPVNAIKVS